MVFNVNLTSWAMTGNKYYESPKLDCLEIDLSESGFCASGEEVNAYSKDQYDSEFFDWE